MEGRFLELKAKSDFFVRSSKRSNFVNCKNTFFVDRMQVKKLRDIGYTLTFLASANMGPKLFF